MSKKTCFYYKAGSVFNKNVEIKHLEGYEDIFIWWKVQLEEFFYKRQYDSPQIWKKLSFDEINDTFR